jgi:hypothetical protein
MEKANGLRVFHGTDHAGQKDNVFMANTSSAASKIRETNADSGGFSVLPLPFRVT